jgi:hypothetical protein
MKMVLAPVAELWDESRLTDAMNGILYLTTANAM